MSRTDQPKQCAFCDKYTHPKELLGDNNCDFCGKDLDIEIVNGVQYDCSTDKGVEAHGKAIGSMVLNTLKMTKAKNRKDKNP